MNKTIRNAGTRTHRPRTANMLSAEEERQLVRAWQEHNDKHARDRLIQAFAPLAVSMAKRSTPIFGEPDPDLVQQANIGLIKAADRFDPDRGNRFATYAVWRIRAEIQDYKRTNLSVVRRPRSAQLRMAAAQFARLNGAMLDDPVIGQAEDHTHVANDHGIGVKKGTDLRGRSTGSDYSLNIPAFGEEGEERMALLIDPGSLEDPSELHRLDAEVLRSVLGQVLSDLPDRERDIILATQLKDPPVTLQALGTQYGISKERV